MFSIKTSQFTYNTENGLTDDQVRAQRERFGRNEMTPPVREAWWRELLAKFKDPTILILLVSAVISLFVTAVERYGLHNTEAGFVDSIGIFFAVGLATLVGFFSERRSAKEFELLNKVKEDIPIKLIRNGQMTTAKIGELVVGDLIQLDPGDKIPADGVLIDAVNLLIDQAMLTGESVPARKTVFSPEKPLEEIIQTVRPSDAFFAARGTMVTDGRGLMLVTAVGDQTQMGKIAASLADSTGNEETPLVQKLGRLAKMISAVGVAGASGIFTVMAVIDTIQSPLLKSLTAVPAVFAAIAVLSIGIGYLLERFALKPFFASMDMELTSKRTVFLAGIPMVTAAFTILIGVWGMTGPVPDAVVWGIDLLKSVLLAFVVAVTIIVVAVPEGLPMMVTVSLALNMMKMARENCLIRRLVASETIGSATVICTDKTGTLTENRMTPVRFFAEGEIFTPERFDALLETSAWKRLALGLSVNSQANLHIETAADGTEQVQGIGNPTECALLKFLRARGIDYQAARHEYPPYFELGHNSDRKMSVSAGDNPNDSVCLMKGAPERIIAGCSAILINGKPEPIDPYRERLEAGLMQASEDALRVLAVSEESGKCDDCSASDDAACRRCSNRTLIGLVGIADPVRAEVPKAVAQCAAAHIQVKMITGDALATAKAIARESGIYTGSENELAMTSEEFAAVSDEQLPDVAEKIRVLARSTPMDKLRLVKALHQQGEVVAMTGDGTNDAPALKAADVGLSMGITGTEVAKEASDIVLVDDNFRSIVTGVWWGRTLYQNIQRFLQFQLSVNVVALLSALLGPALGVPLPLTVTQLLWINIIMDTFAALALSTDPPRPHTMTENPTRRDAAIVTPTMGCSILLVGLYQTVILFTALFAGWFVAPDLKYDGSISISDPEYLKHNLEPLTVFFTIFVMFQFWHKFNCRALKSGESPFELLSKNRLFLGIVGTITAVQIVMVQIPAVGEFFRTQPLGLGQWLEILALTATVLPVAWLARKIAQWLNLA